MSTPLLGRASAVLLVLVLSGCGLTASPAPGSGNPSAPAGSSPSPGPGGGSTRLVVDTDMAPDDVTAIASLIRDPAVELLAITVVGTGEAHCPGGMFVARSVVTMLRPDAVPVTCGRESPMADAEPFPDAWRAGADSGNGLRLVSPAYAPDPRPAPELLIELADAEATAGRRLTILTLGTLTNLASAVELDPSLPSKVRVVSMLGAIGVPGNVETTPGVAPTAEWNAHADPTAVRRVLEAGFDLTLIPLDATNSTPLTAGLSAELASDHAAGPADLVFELWSRNPYMVSGGFYLWDPLAAVALRDPSVVTTRETSLRVVEGAGPDGGRLIEDPTGARVTIATSADRGAFESFLLARLRLGPPRAGAFTAVGELVVSGRPGTCDVRLDPQVPEAGVLRLTLSNVGDVPLMVVVFGLGAATWSEIQAFAAAGPASASPPPVTDIAFTEVAVGETGTVYGEAPSGDIGVACLTGTFEDPNITLAGPFAIGR